MKIDEMQLNLQPFIYGVVFFAKINYHTHGRKRVKQNRPGRSYRDTLLSLNIM